MTTASKIDSYLVPDELADILPLCETDRLLLKDVHVPIIFRLSSLFLLISQFSQLNDLFRRAIKDWVRHKRRDSVRHSGDGTPRTPPGSAAKRQRVFAPSGGSRTIPPGEAGAAAGSSLADSCFGPDEPALADT